MKQFLILIILCALLLGCTGCALRAHAPTATEPPGFTLGTVVGQTYSNAYLGMGCRLNNPWSFMPAVKLEDFSTSQSSCAMYATLSGQETVRLDFLPVPSADFSSSQLPEFCNSYLKEILPSLCFGVEESDAVFSDCSVWIGNHYVTGEQLCVPQGNRNVYVAAFAIRCTDHIARFSVTTDLESRIEAIMACFFQL